MIFSALLLLVAFDSAPAFADWAQLPSEDFDVVGFPVEGSPAYKRDFEVLHRYQEERSNAQCAMGRRQEHPSYGDIFMGKDSPLSAADAQLTKDLGTRVMKLADRISTYYKNKYRRPRPYDTDSSLEPCGVKPGGEKSYPSTHATAAAAGACVLAEVFSSSRQMILDYGDSSGELRVVIGVHHPSDVEAGQKLGRDICTRLLSMEEFRSELDRLKHR